MSALSTQTAALGRLLLTEMRLLVRLRTRVPGSLAADPGGLFLAYFAEDGLC